MKKPNLFSYATSELSQDAFICWLLSWASPEFQDSDSDLHNCAVNLIEAMFSKHDKKAPKIEQIEVRKQDKHIDVLCIVNNTYPILIEDKTGTKNSPDQLARYLEDIKSRDFDESNIIPIYFKTEDQASYSDIEKNKYKPFKRSDILRILNAYKGLNAILIDYRSHLQLISEKVESYKNTEISKWGWYAWVGFYLELQKQLGSGNWDYVSNPAGGFLGFWWHFQGNDDCEQYLQLEENKLCFKIWVKNNDERTRLRAKWYKIVKEQGPSYGLELVKPARFGNGEYMTICIFNGEYRETKDDIIDMDKTVERLKKAENLLKSVNETE